MLRCQFGTTYQLQSSTRSSARAAGISSSKVCAEMTFSTSLSITGWQAPIILFDPVSFAAAQVQ